MNQPAHKCEHCKKAFPIRKIDQKYCSNACRQAAYRKRMQPVSIRKAAPAEPILVATCDHCGGSFWAKTKRSQFCSTSCRTLNHRMMRAGLAAALEAYYHVPAATAADLVET